MSSLTPEQAKQLDETLVNCQRAVLVVEQILDSIQNSDGRSSDIAVALARHDADADAHGGYAKMSWILEEAVASGGILTLPDGYAYVPGVSRLDLSFEGADCCPGQQYEELAAGTDGLAHGVKLLFSAEVGSSFQARIHYVRKDAEQSSGTDSASSTCNCGKMTAAGYTTDDGAVVTPVSVVGDGGVAPENAALTLQLDNIDS